MKALVIFSAVVLLLLPAHAAFAAHAAGLGRGATVFGVELTGGQADYTVPVFVSQPGGITFVGVQSAQRPEVGIQGQFWYFPSEHFAFSVSGGMGITTETDHPGPFSDPGASDRKREMDSWQIRVGGDRVSHLAFNSIHIFLGPGIEVWNGKNELIEQGIDFEDDDVTRVALSGRVAAHLAVNNTVGLILHLDHFVGRATTSQAGSDASWWTSGNEGGVGLAFRF